MICKWWVVPWLRQFVAGLSPWKSAFTPKLLQVKFVVEKMVLGQASF